MLKNKWILLIFTIVFSISVFLHFYKINQVPPCLNADEVAHGYNAYSIMKTGKDEYGRFLPFRFKSFGEYKMPLYIYTLIPFIKLLDLNDFSIRLFNDILGISFIFILYYLTKEITNSKKVALLTSFLISLTPWVYILSRHAHEAVLSAFLMLISWIFLIRFEKKSKLNDFLLTNIFIFLSASTYNASKTFLIFFFLYQIYLILKTKGHSSLSNIIVKMSIVTVATVSPFLFDYFLGASRVTNLFYIKNPGFSLRLDEYMGEHSFRLFHNKLLESILDITRRYFTQISTDFFLINGDRNWRFGFYGIGLITPFEFIMFFAGIYFIFKNKINYKFILLSLLFLSPLTNALTWQDQSLTRTYFMIFPFMIIVAYGIYHFYLSTQNKKIFLIASVLVYGFFLINSWDIYFFHYSKKTAVIKSWQCGYEELGNYVKDNYNRFDKFYITKDNGQPYIYMLFYLKYNPEKYQKQANLTGPDKYGFGQVEQFDKFIFSFKKPDISLANSAIIGSPDDFKNLPVESYNENRIIKLTKNGKDTFWIYELTK